MPLSHVADSSANFSLSSKIRSSPAESGQVRPSPGDQELGQLFGGDRAVSPASLCRISPRVRGQPAFLPVLPTRLRPAFRTFYSGADLAGSIRQGAEDVGLQLLAPRGRGAALSAGQLLGDEAAAAAGAVPSAAAEMAR